MLPVVILGTVLGGIYAAFMSGWVLAVSWHDMALLFLWGMLISGMVHAVFTWGSRYVPGAELTLLILIEFILSPMWVWLVIDERPESRDPGRRHAGHRRGGEPGHRELPDAGRVTLASGPRPRPYTGGTCGRQGRRCAFVSYRISDATAAAIAAASTRSMSSRGGA